MKTRRLLVATAAGVLTLGFAPPASAAGPGDSAAKVTVQGGFLSITVPANAGNLGTEANPDTGTSPPVNTTSTGRGGWLYPATAGLVVLFLLGIALLVVRRRHRHRPRPTSETAPFIPEAIRLGYRALLPRESRRRGRAGAEPAARPKVVG